LQIFFWNMFNYFFFLLFDFLCRFLCFVIILLYNFRC
jgi:hypothetical protein